MAINLARSAAVKHPFGNGSSLPSALIPSRASCERLMSATRLPPIAVNACEADAVAGVRCAFGATEVTLHPLELQLPAGDPCGETTSSKRNETSRRRGTIFIVETVEFLIISSPARRTTELVGNPLPGGNKPPLLGFDENESRRTEQGA